MNGSHTHDPLAVAAALRSLAGVEHLAVELAEVGVPLLVLKGPHVQRRLLGSPAAYISADADVLVPRRGARQTRRKMSESGWHFAEENGRMWRLDGAAAYGRNGVVIDLHWGLHVGLVPATALRPIERAMWSSAQAIAPNLFEPSIDALAAYLAIHNAGSWDRPDKMGLLAAAMDGADRHAVIELAARCRLGSTATDTIDAAAGHRTATGALDPARERYGRLAPVAVGWRRLAARRG